MNSAEATPELINMEMRLEQKCSKCQGTGWYGPPNQRGTIHHYKCDACCKHEGERWQLKEHFGEDNGKWCCRAGCGKTWETEKDER